MSTRFVRILKDQSVFYAIWDQETFYVIDKPPYLSYKKTGQVFQKKDVDVQSPVLPSKIIAIGLNYRSHVFELNMSLPEEPLIFLKPITALANPNDVIALPGSSHQVDYEGELAIVIGKKGRHIKPDEVDDYILGYTLANDVTARDLQQKDGQWARAKGFDGFCPIGPAIISDVDPKQLNFSTFLNDEKKQVGNIDDLIFSIPRIVAFVSEVMTLYPEDVILTGTPPGIGQVVSGDKVRITCDTIGSLENYFIGKR